jgi:hypothetical protein
MYLIWGNLHDNLSAMDSVFLGASQPQVEVKEDDYIEEEDEVKDKEHKEHKELNTNSSLSSVQRDTSTTVTPTTEEE